MIEPGILMMKTAGKDAGKIVVVVDVADNSFATIDGPVKRKRCNIKHLEPLNKKIDIRKGASTALVHEALKKAKIPVKTSKPRAKKERPRKIRKEKLKEVKKEVKKENKKK